MAANVIFKSKDSKIVDTIIDSIIKEIKKGSKAIKGEDNAVIPYEFGMCGHGHQPFGCNPHPQSFIDFQIKVGDKVFSGLGYKDIDEIAHWADIYMAKYIPKKVYKAVNFFNDSFFDYPSTFIPNNYKYLKGIVLLGKPCKTFKKLQAEVDKISNKKFDLADFRYILPTHFLTQDSEECDLLLSEIRRHKGQRISDIINTHDMNGRDFDVKMIWG